MILCPKRSLDSALGLDHSGIAYHNNYIPVSLSLHCFAHAVERAGPIHSAHRYHALYGLTSQREMPYAAASIATKYLRRAPRFYRGCGGLVTASTQSTRRGGRPGRRAATAGAPG